MEPRELEDLLYLQARIMSDYRDPRRGSYRYGYLFAETVDNADSAFYRAIQLVDAGEVDWLVVPEGHLGHGYAGYDASVARLKALGFKGQVPILKINVDAAINTRNEMDAFVSYQMAYRVGDIALIAPPFHMPRAFMTAITVFERAGLQSRAYAVPGIPLPWSDEVAHSQGPPSCTAGLLY